MSPTAKLTFPSLFLLHNLPCLNTLAILFTISKFSPTTSWMLPCPMLIRNWVSFSRSTSSNDSFSSYKSSSSSSERLSNSSDPSDCHSLKSLSSLSSWWLSSLDAYSKFSSTSLSNTSTSPIYSWHNECTSKSCKPSKSTLTIPKSKSSPGSEVPTGGAYLLGGVVFLFEGLGIACNVLTGLLGLHIWEELFYAAKVWDGLLPRVRVGDSGVVGVVWDLVGGLLGVHICWKGLFSAAIVWEWVPGRVAVGELGFSWAIWDLVIGLLGLLRSDTVWEVGDSTGWQAIFLEGEAGLGLFVVGVDEGVDFKK